MKSRSPLLLTALAIYFTSIGAYCQTTVATDPMGFVSETCLAGSDTYLSVPFHQPPAYVGALTSAPTVSGSTATLTFSAPGWTANQFQNTHYVRFISGEKLGYYYQVASNDATSLTIDLNGDTIGATSLGDQIQLIPFWTLNTLFPPATQTTIVASSGNLSFQRKTEILFPDRQSAGSDLAPNQVYFLTAVSGWVQDSSGFPSAGSVVIPPDSYFIVRHPVSVSSTTYLPTGTIDNGVLVIPLTTLSNAPQDNSVALCRPIPVALQDSGLASGFVASNGNLSFQRRDQLLVYDNTVAAFDKSASAIYFMVGTNWIQDTSGFPVVNTSQIFQPGTGIVIRKYQTAGGSTAFWQNSPTY